MYIKETNKQANKKTNLNALSWKHLPLVDIPTTGEIRSTSTHPTPFTNDDVLNSTKDC